MLVRELHNNMKVAGSQKILVNGWGTQKGLDLMWVKWLDLVMVYPIDWHIPLTILTYYG